MKANQLIESYGFNHMSGSKLEQEITGVYIGDLLSWVMSHAKKGDCWLTVQTHLNILAIATLVELSCIIIVEDAPIDEDTIKKAKEEDILILHTNKTAFEVALLLSEVNG